MKIRRRKRKVHLISVKLNKGDYRDVKDLYLTVAKPKIILGFLNRDKTVLVDVVSDLDEEISYIR